MLKDSDGYMGLVPRISYSRHFGVGDFASNEKIHQKTERSVPSKIICAGENVQGRQKVTLMGKKASSVELTSRGIHYGARKDNKRGKEYLLPPSQKFKTPLSATYSPQIKLITDSSQSLLSSTCTADNDLSCELSRREASRVKEQVSLKFYSDSQGKNGSHQRWKILKSDLSQKNRRTKLNEKKLLTRGCNFSVKNYSCQPLVVNETKRPNLNRKRKKLFQHDGCCRA